MEVNLFPLFLSLRVALTATFFAFIIGVPIALYLQRSKSRFASILETLVTLPIILPPTVLGYYLLVLLGRQSYIGEFLENTFGISLVFTPTGAVIAALIVSIPFMIKSATTAFGNIDPMMVQSARLLGRTEWNIFFTILMPLAWRGMLAGITLAFARAIGDFGATLMVAGSIPNQTQTMPLAIYDALLAGDRELANILVLIMTVVALLLLFAINRLEKYVGKRNRVI
ncbi:molybdate ABC transporter permease subunit [Saliterribacillus persicus]|uniref:Molybdenum transport system permease n=1 Tax=Saliterribacillus persicus TaxID=930114 RepID=A0A368YDE4_9BACI|nr:molybdate ABC transporter permease subunit [Saliterribacillus persicus]RCW76897.1 molybdate transport system permease protein [Saliterribacillus persicus]